MGKRGLLGEFEQVVLLSLRHAGQRATGAAIHEEIERRGGQEVAITAVYVTLARLEAKGLVASGSGPAEAAGRTLKTFRIEEAGLEALQRSREHLARFWSGLDTRRAGGS
jgi:DNA-binding PadR family transcriptional regulator